MALLVFMSHSSADKPTARLIRDALEDKGVNVWLDETHIRVGHSIPERIAAGLRAADLFCLLVSKSALESKWVMREFESFIQEAMKDDRPVIPCRLDKSEPPTLISSIKYADFSDDFDRGLNDLLGAVKIADDIHERETIRDYVNRAKIIIERVLAANSSRSRLDLLTTIKAGVENQNITDDQDQLLSQLANECANGDDEEFSDGIMIGDLGLWYVNMDMETAIDELIDSCLA
ncbi:MAG: toll/interleukin-1 receptor domain-containing protein [Hyphomicrobiaceae bacterium]